VTDLIDDVVREARSAVDSVTSAAERAVRDAQMYLASPRGKRMRANVARGLVAVAPAVAGAPLLRRSWVVRLLGAAGAATVLVKVAEAIRDWEPDDGPA
jgi:hypothetical protein